MKKSAPVELIAPGTLRTVVAEAVQQKRDAEYQAKAEASARDEAKLRSLLRDKLGVEYSEVFEQHGGFPVAQIEGFRFTLTWIEYDHGLAWLRTCPDCHEDESVFVYGFESLDETREMGWTHRNGQCAKKQADAVQTTESRLLEALRDLIAR